MLESEVDVERRAAGCCRPRLAEFRERAGYPTARSFAMMIGVSASVYESYESGRTKMTLAAACLFADLLGCTVDELAGRTVR